MMQTVWLYIDDIAGKGADLIIITELLFYLSISLFPSALSIATLIASVFVMGNLAERYELASMKSAGVSLIRIMRPLIVTTAFISCFSFVCNNYFAPYSNLKFRSRLYDIRKQKPTLNLTPSIFNYDFQGYTIRIGDKESNNKTIKDVLIYDNNTTYSDRFSVTNAVSGEMYGSNDDRFFIMNLYNGSRSEESKPSPGKNNYPFVRLNFKKWTKVFDLSQFDLNRTDENLFKSHQTMLTSGELFVAIDSIDSEISGRADRASAQVSDFWRRYRTNKHEIKPIVITNESKDVTQKIDSVYETTSTETRIKALFGKKTEFAEESLPKKAENNVHPDQLSTLTQPTSIFGSGAKQVFTKELKDYDMILETFAKTDQKIIISNALSQVKNVETQIEIMDQSILKILESKAKHIFQLISKYSIALACMIFLFIGAPMGAIVRKGGFGYPILVAIIFFMIFVTLNILFQRLAERNVLNPYLAAWMPSIILMAVGTMLTFKALNDSQLSINIDFKAIFQNLTKRFRKNQGSTI